MSRKAKGRLQGGHPVERCHNQGKALGSGGSSLLEREVLVSFRNRRLSVGSHPPCSSFVAKEETQGQTDSCVGEC